MTCQLNIIVAVCDDWGIGRAGDMVVANKADMRHFVRMTRGHAVIMGRKTLDSFPSGKPLKDRRNIVLTRDPLFHRSGVEAVRSVEEALERIADEDEAWVIGGAQVYRQLLPLCSTAVVTKNHCIRPADAFFPNLDDDASWRLLEETDTQQVGEGEGDEGVFYSFATYRRVGGAGE